MTTYASAWIDRNVYYKEKSKDHFEQYERPVIVCLCGSTRFYQQFQEANYKETIQGKIVLSVGFYPHISKKRMIVDGCMGEQEVLVDIVSEHSQEKGCTPKEKIKLDELHLRKIDLADEILILNVGGYIGESTRRELEHAKKKGKLIRYLESLTK